MVKRLLPVSFLALLFGLLLPVMAMAQTADNPLAGAALGKPDPTAQALIEKMVQPGTNVFYLGDEYGMPGFLLQRDDNIQILYATPDRRGLMNGALYNDKDELVTAQQLQRLRDSDPRVAALFQQGMNQMQDAFGQVKDDVLRQQKLSAAAVSPGEKLLRELVAAHGVTIGQANAPELTMVVDPLCRHCKKAWGQFAEPYLKAGSVKLRLVPVDILGERSRNIAAHWLEMADKEAGWNRIVDGKLDGLTDNPPLPGLQKVISNRALFDRWKLPSTPYIVYRDRAGVVKVVDGVPEQISQIIADLPPPVKVQ